MKILLLVIAMDTLSLCQGGWWSRALQPNNMNVELDICMIPTSAENSFPIFFSFFSRYQTIPAQLAPNNASVVDRLV